MNIMVGYAKSDKDWFPCAYPEVEGKRASSTFFGDFTVAEAYGEPSIRDTFNRCFDEWKDNYKMFTELVVVLNHLLWLHYDREENERAKLYDKIWRKCVAYVNDHYEGEAAEHYFMVTD
jgi:hypothetical protein